MSLPRDAIPHSIRLEARNPARNVARFYTLEASRDLLGDLVLTLTSGRIGTSGCRRVLAVGDEAAVQQEIARRLRRRRSAPKRLGCEYERVYPPPT